MKHKLSGLSKITIFCFLLGLSPFIIGIVGRLLISCQEQNINGIVTESCKFLWLFEVDTTLKNMPLFGWFGIITIPLSVGLYFIMLIFYLIHVLSNDKKNRDI